MTYLTGPHRPTGPLQYRPIGIRPERPDGQSAPATSTMKVITYEYNVICVFCPSPRFVASCGFTTDVKVWEVCFGKGGEFKEVARAFDLKGHSAGVHAFAFSNDSHK